MHVVWTKLVENEVLDRLLDCCKAAPLSAHKLSKRRDKIRLQLANKRACHVEVLAHQRQLGQHLALQAITQRDQKRLDSLGDQTEIELDVLQQTSQRVRIHHELRLGQMFEADGERHRVGSSAVQESHIDGASDHAVKRCDGFGQGRELAEFHRTDLVRGNQWIDRRPELDVERGTIRDKGRKVIRVW